jgi:hypothetical protein
MNRYTIVASLRGAATEKAVQQIEGTPVGPDTLKFPRTTLIIMKVRIPSP